MTSEFLWFFNAPDGEYPWEPEGRRKVHNLRHFKALSAGLEELPYAGALVATTTLHEPLIHANVLAQHTTRLRPLVAVLPGLISPTTLANMALSFADLYDDRLIINVINAESPLLAQQGVHLDNDGRYELADEYWTLFRRLTEGEVFDHEGKYYNLKQAGASFRLPPRKIPLWFSGSSAAALDFAARHSENYLTFAEPLELLSEKIARVRELAARHNRSIRIGIRAPLIARETDEQAWAVAAKYLAVTNPETLKRRADIVGRGGKSGGKSVSAQRISGLIDPGVFARLRGGVAPADPRALEVADNLWLGNTFFHDGPPAALVGSYEAIAARLRQYEALGADTFILSAHPFLEQAYSIAEHLLPLLGVKPFQ